MKSTFRKSYGSVNVLTLKELPIPEPKSNEILVKIKASTVNRTDEGGLLGKPYIFRFFVGWPKPRKVATGSDFSGTIVKKGVEVKSFEVGEDIYGFYDAGLGTHAEYACISEEIPIFRKPINISHEQAAASLEGAHYAYYFLERAPLKEGAKVMVNGATGAIGNAAIQMLLARGVELSFTYPTDSYEKVKHLRAMHQIDYLKEDFTKIDAKFDIVFDAVGKSSFGAVKHLLKPQGIYISSELGPKGENIPLSILGLFKKGKKVVFPFPGNPKKSIAYTRDLLESGQFVPLIDRVYPLEQYAEAFSLMLSGQKRGSVILVMEKA